MRSALELKNRAMHKCGRAIKRTEREMVYTVSNAELRDLRLRIAYKTERNEDEREASLQLASKYIVHY